MTGQDCARYRDLAAEYAVTDLDGRERVELIDHLQRCGGCRRELRAYTEVADALLLGLPAVEPPSGLDGRVLAHIEQRRRDDDLDADTLWMGDADPRPPRHRSLGGLTLVTGGAHSEESSQADDADGGPLPGDDAQLTALRCRLPDPDRVLPPRPDGSRPRGSFPLGRRHTRRALFIALVVLLGVVGGTLGFVAVSAHAGPSTSAPSAVPPTAGPVLHAPLTSGSEAVGQIYAHPGQLPGDPTWIYVVLDRDRSSTPPGDVVMSIQLLDDRGTTRTVGTLSVTDGYGVWAGPVPENPDDLTAAQLTESAGTPYAGADLVDP